eukprot:6203016-Pleurochrysis_carterae.AAC.2
MSEVHSRLLRDWARSSRSRARLSLRLGARRCRSTTRPIRRTTSSSRDQAAPMRALGLRGRRRLRWSLSSGMKWLLERLHRIYVGERISA